VGEAGQACRRARRCEGKRRTPRIRLQGSRRAATALPTSATSLRREAKPAEPAPAFEDPKMFVEERIYTMHPGKIGDYIKAYAAEGLAIQKPILGRLVGYYSTEFGPLNQVIHMWAYETLAERAERRTKLFANQDWLNYLAKVRPFIATQESKLLIPAPFMQVKWQD
jgi:hypothetical protein